MSSRALPGSDNATRPIRTELVPFLFDTDAISELLRPRPLPRYVEWLQTVRREDQYTSAVTVGELFKGAYWSRARERHLTSIEDRVLPAVTVLPYDVATARVFGRIRAQLEEDGQIRPDADIQIAATALFHDLELVTGNFKHFERIPNLQLCRILEESRQNG